MTAPARLLALLAIALVAAGCVKGADEAGDPVETAANATAPGEETPGGSATIAANLTANASAPRVALLVTLDGFYPVTSHYKLDKGEIPSGALVDLTFKNADLNPLGKHDWLLEGVEGAKTKVIDAGVEDRVTFTAPAPGEYTYICSVPTHKDHGLIGKLKVV